MKKLWLVNVCIIVSGLLGLVNIFTENSPLETIITCIFVFAVVSVAHYPKHMWDTLMTHFDEASTTANQQSDRQAMSEGGLYSSFALLFLLGCICAALGSVWVNDSLGRMLAILVGSIILGIVLGLLFPDNGTASDV